MFTVSLVLDKLRITSLVDELEVSVNTSVSLICPDKDIRILEPSRLLALLCSGTLWVTRGNGCRLEFTILLDGQKVDQQSRETMIQNLSYYLQDAPVSCVFALYLDYSPLKTSSYGLKFCWTQKLTFHNSMEVMTLSQISLSALDMPFLQVHLFHLGAWSCQWPQMSKLQQVFRVSSCGRLESA
jgi:hypothetical protein